MRFLIALALLVSANVASAADWEIPDDALPKDCDASSDAGLGHCSYLAFENADAELNEVWKRSSPSSIQIAHRRFRGPMAIRPSRRPTG